MLTRDDVMALSGRELDAAVSEFVMKVPVEWIPFPNPDVNEVYTAESNEGYGPNDLVLAYSSDWSAMGALIERMRRLGWNPRLGSLTNEMFCGFHDDSAVQKSAYVDDFNEVAQIPENFARAALLAVGEEMHRDLQAPL